MNQIQIVSALLTAARAAVWTQYGARAEVLWPLVEPAAREVARELAAELAADLPAALPAAPLELRPPRPAAPPRQAPRALPRTLPRLEAGEPVAAPVAASGVGDLPLVEPSPLLLRKRRVGAGAGLVPVTKRDKNGVLTTRYVTPAMARALAKRESFFEEEAEAPKPAPATPAPTELVEVEAPEPEPLAEEEEPEEPTEPLPTYRTSEDRPPDFLAVRLERLPFVRIPGGGRYGDAFNVDTERDPFLRVTGFWKDLSTWQRGFYLDQLAREKKYEDLSPRQQGFYAAIYRVLASWWADLNDDEREQFVAKYVDLDRMPPEVTVDDPRHQMADFPLPKGLEPLAERGFQLHEYQKKAANFAIHHAPRALWAMEMGLGKTLTAIATFLALREKGEVDRMLVVSPVSAHGAWQSHLDDFTRGLRATYLTGATAKKRHEAYADFEAGRIDVLVVSPDAFAVSDEDLKAAETPAELDKLGEGWTAAVKDLAGNTSVWKKKAKEGRGKKARILWEAPRTGFTKTSEELLGMGGEVRYDASDAARMNQILAGTPPYGAKLGPRVLRVADEVQKFKTSDSARTKGFRQAVTQPEGRVIGMTGTPKPNKIVDFFEIVNGIKKGALGADVREFANRYAYFDKDGQIVALRPDKLGQLHQDHAGIIFARTTADPDSRINLPPRTDLAPLIPMDSTQLEIEREIKRYMELLRRARAEEKQNPEAGSPARQRIEEARAGLYGPIERAAARSAPSTSQGVLLRWQQLAIDPSALDAEFPRDFPDYESPKIKTIANAVVKHLDANPEAGAVVFGEFHKGIDAIRRALVRRGIDPKKMDTYDGSVPAKRRRELEKALNTGQIRVLLGQTAALETGANLQKRADYVAHLNTPWAPDRLTQSTARVYRQGQQNPVTVLRPVGSPVEALIERVVTRKVRESAQAVGRMMVADKQATRQMDKREKAKLDRKTIAATLGIDEDLLSDQGAIELAEPEEMERGMFGGGT